MIYEKNFSVYTQEEQDKFEDWVYDTKSIIFKKIQNKKFIAPAGIEIYSSTDWDTIELTDKKTIQDTVVISGNNGGFFIQNGILTYLVLNAEDGNYYRLDDLVEQHNTSNNTQNNKKISPILLIIGGVLIYNILKK